MDEDYDARWAEIPELLDDGGDELAGDDDEHDDDDNHDGDTLAVLGIDEAELA